VATPRRRHDRSVLHADGDARARPRDRPEDVARHDDPRGHARALDVTSDDDNWGFDNTRDSATSLGQLPFASPSVFNFYRPGYVAPRTPLSDLDLVAPEFQIVDETWAIGWINWLASYLRRPRGARASDLDALLAMADDDRAVVAPPASSNRGSDRSAGRSGPGHTTLAAMSKVQLVGIVGSLRTASVNATLARAAVEAMPDDADMSLHDVHALPLYHGDEEAAGPPAEVIRLHDAIRPADGLVLFSPEYNSSLPAVTKNVIDWLSRDPSVWEDDGITMVSMSPGSRAGAGARDHFTAIMSRQAPREFETLGFGRYGDRLDDGGNVTDPATLAELADFLARFVTHCRSRSADR